MDLVVGYFDFSLRASHQNIVHRCLLGVVEAIRYAEVRKYFPLSMFDSQLRVSEDQEEVIFSC